VSVLLHLLKWQLGLAAPEVWTTEAERVCLARHAAGRHRVAEIGVWHGGTARRLRQAMAADGVFYAIDPYARGALGFSAPRVIGRRELGRVRNGRVVWIRQTGYDAAQGPTIRDAAPFDFVFIDAAQTYEMLDREWKAWAPLMAPGGLIALHDSRFVPEHGPAEQTSVRYTREVVLTDPRFEVIDTVDALTVLRRLSV
jgi:predicted O-methyltransferase YrrM